MKQGEVWRIRLPGGGGHAQAGERPAVVIQSDAGAKLPTTIVVPFTSNAAALRFAGTVSINPDVHNDLTTTSVALVFQTTALDRRNFVTKLGHLHHSELDAILTQLDRLLGR